MTGLPIIETKANDVSAYIPTNVISITDGQIFLQSDLFNANQRPAIDVGISVSRVGGAAQVKAMKAVSGSLKINLAQYRDMQAFAMFASDLDAATRRQLDRGARLTELLRQGQYAPYPVEDQVVSACGPALEGHFDDVPVDDVLRFEREFLDYLRHNTHRPADDRGHLPVRRRLTGCDDHRAWPISSAMFRTSEGKLLVGREEHKPLEDGGDRPGDDRPPEAEADSDGQQSAGASRAPEVGQHDEEDHPCHGADRRVAHHQGAAGGPVGPALHARADQGGLGPGQRCTTWSIRCLVDVEHPQRSAMLLITVDRGLAGAYSANVIKAAEQLHAKLHGRGPGRACMYITGQKGVAYYDFRRPPRRAELDRASPTRPATPTLGRSPTCC